MKLYLKINTDNYVISYCKHPLGGYVEYNHIPNDFDKKDMPFTHWHLVNGEWVFDQTKHDTDTVSTANQETLWNEYHTLRKKMEWTHFKKDIAGISGPGNTSDEKERMQYLIEELNPEDL